MVAGELINSDAFNSKMTDLKLSAGAEWRRYGMLPFAAGLGYATSVIHIYGLGPYIEPIQEAFGWSRAQATSGLTIATIINAVFCIVIGMLVDRVGPRLLGLQLFADGSGLLAHPGPVGG